MISGPISVVGLEAVADDDLVARLGEARRGSESASLRSSISREPALHTSPCPAKMPNMRELHRHIEVRVGEDDVRAFAAEFERDLLDVAQSAAS